MATNVDDSIRDEPFAGRELLVGVCGGIAAYKTAALVSALVQRGAGVTVVMTSSATRFVGPLTFESLTSRQVVLDLWSAEHDRDSQHIHLAERANLIIVAPATANILGKVSGGLADDALSTIILASPAPVLFAPSMNGRMWKNPIVQSNVARLRETGYRFVGPDSGWLACRTMGLGRMSEPETILSEARTILDRQSPIANRES